MPKARSPELTKRERFYKRFTPGEVWYVQCSYKGGPLTDHYTLIGFPPPEWEKKYQRGVRVHRVMSVLRLGTPSDVLTMEEIDRNFLFLRRAPLEERHWTVNFTFDWKHGNIGFVQCVGFADWIEPEDRVMLPEFEGLPLPQYKKPGRKRKRDINEF